MAARPIIGITGPDRGGLPAWLFTSLAVRRAGGKPVRVRPSRRVPPRLDGLIIGGGADVAPVHYDGSVRVRPPRVRRRGVRGMLDLVIAGAIFAVRWLLGRHASAPPFDLGRDALELTLIDWARRSGLPLLGICRGAQLLNVHAGGTLHQDLSQFYVERPNRWTVFPRKHARFVPTSRLSGTLGTTEGYVNSLHRQAIATLGDGLVAVAFDDSGVVQAVEDPDRELWLGVQWHPEYLPQLRPQRQVFTRLVDAARAALPTVGD